MVATLLVLVVAAGTYAGTLRNGFVWDDTLVLERQLAAFRTPLDVLEPPANIPQFSPFYYRPVVVLTYLIDHASGGGGPLSFHVTSLVLHLVACALAFLLFFRLLGPTSLTAATAGALVFAVHPVHSEVVSWMAGRSDALATVGCLAALLAWGSWVETSRVAWLAVGTGALAVGLLSKEAAIAVVPLAAVLPWVWPPTGGRAGRRASPDRVRSGLWTAIVVAVLAYMLLRIAALGFAAGASRPSAVRLDEVLGGLGFYARGFLWPRTVGVVRTFAPTDTRDIALGLGAVAAWSVAMVTALRQRARVAAWALAWIALGLGPPLLLLLRSISETPVAERYLYMPSVGVALLIAWVLTRLPERWTGAGLAMVGLAIVASAWWSVRQVPTWRDDTAFWDNAVAAAPDEGFPRIKLAVLLDRRGEEAAAESTLLTALSLRLSSAQEAVALNNLGWLFLRQGKRDEAESLFRRAVAARPGFPGPYRGLAECLWPRGEDPQVRGEIRTLLERAVTLDHTEARAAFLLANVYLAEGARDQARHWLEQTIRANPQSASAAQARAALAELQGR